MSMLKIGSVVLAAAAAAVFAAHPATTAVASQPARDPAKTLSVTIVGSTSAARNTNCQYTAYVSGGTPPYTYSWIGSGLIDGWSDQTATYQWSTFGNKAIHVDVSDALSDTGSGDLGVTVLSTGSC